MILEDFYLKVALTIQSKSKKAAYYAKDIQAVFDHAIKVCKLNPSVSVGLICIDDHDMHQMNKQYRNIDKTTDVLTFVDEIDPEYLGDIFINMQQATLQAKTFQHSFRREFCFLFVHGVLHTLGYDHQDKVSEKIMNALTEEILINVAPKGH